MPKNVANETLYLSNLNERVALEEMKQQLQQLFSPYGEIVRIIAKKNIRLRGQAFIIFKKLESAKASL